MNLLEKIKDMYEDLTYKIPDSMIFIIKCSVICIIWITLIA